MDLYVRQISSTKMYSKGQRLFWFVGLCSDHEGIQAVLKSYIRLLVSCYADEPRCRGSTGYGLYLFI